MAEVLECTECGKVFSTEETVEKHADRVHDTKEVIEENGGLFDL